MFQYPVLNLIMHMVERTGSGQLGLTSKGALVASNSCGFATPLSRARTATHLEAPLRFGVGIVAKP
jgi:hypothetical protein